MRRIRQQQPQKQHFNNSAIDDDGSQLKTKQVELCSHLSLVHVLLMLWRERDRFCLHHSLHDATMLHPKRCTKRQERWWEGSREVKEGRTTKKCCRRFTFRNQPPTASSPTMFAHVGSNKVRPKFLDATVFYPIDVKPIWFWNAFHKIWIGDVVKAKVSFDPSLTPDHNRLLCNLLGFLSGWPWENHPTTPAGCTKERVKARHQLPLLTNVLPKAL